MNWDAFFLAVSIYCGSMIIKLPVSDVAHKATNIASMSAPRRSDPVVWAQTRPSPATRFIIFLHDILRILSTEHQHKQAMRNIRLHMEMLLH